MVGSTGEPWCITYIALPSVLRDWAEHCAGTTCSQENDRETAGSVAHCPGRKQIMRFIIFLFVSAMNESPGSCWGIGWICWGQGAFKIQTEFLGSCCPSPHPITQVHLFTLCVCVGEEVLNYSICLTSLRTFKASVLKAANLWSSKFILNADNSEWGGGINEQQGWHQNFANQKLLQ